MIAAIALMLAAPAAALDPAAAPDWRAVATDADRIRLRAWRTSWQAAIAAVRDRAAVAADPALLDPDQALDRPLPPDGAYRCRMVKVVGDRLVANDWTRCRIDAAILERADGAERFVGRLYAADTHRGVFLGAVAYGDERRPAGYGRYAGRDMAGLVQRIGKTRWRVAMPAPRFQSRLDVLELTPDG